MNPKDLKQIIKDAAKKEGIPADKLEAIWKYQFVLLREHIMALDDRGFRIKNLGMFKMKKKYRDVNFYDMRCFRERKEKGIKLVRLIKKYVYDRVRFG